ncbi:hypothetical protein AMJ80_05675 [bacterium SM23_31]|nr:MAG: hypothetical protein AMJ80_05675 [bacterium SM23_31]
MKLLNDIKLLLKATYIEWRKQRPELLSAAISFYVIFSLGPVLVIIIGIVGLLFGKQVAESQIIQEIQRSIGPKLAEVIQTLIEEAFLHPARELTTILSIPIVVFGASMLFYRLKNTLNVIWDVKPQSRSNLITAIKSYIFSFLMVIILGILLMMLIIKSFLLVLFQEFLNNYIPFPVYLLQIIDGIFTFLAVTILFAVTYKVLLETPIRWRDIWVGASVTSFMFIISQFIIGLYISKAEVGTAYGALGSLTILLVWIFYSSSIYLVGAVFTKVYSQRLWVKTF